MAPNFGGIKLDFSVQSSPLALNFTSSGEGFLSEFQTMLQQLELQYGAYTSDLAKGKYSLSWDSLDDMYIWLKKEQETKFIELQPKETLQNMKGDRWTTKHVYVCARQGTGGIKKYEKKFPEHGRKVPTKQCSCTCCLIIKCYPNTAQVLRLYEDNHSHATGHDNARFTCLAADTRLQIAEMLRMGISHKCIVCLSAFAFSYKLTFVLVVKDTRRYIQAGQTPKHSTGCKMWWFYYIKRYTSDWGKSILFAVLIHLLEEIRLHQNDGESIVQWVECLQKSREILAFKSSAEPAPDGSGLAADTFVLMIQTHYQKEVFEKYGHGFAGIDAHIIRHIMRIWVYSRSLFGIIGDMVR